MNRQLSRDDIGNQGRVLLNDFIVERLKGDHVQSDLRQEELLEPGTPSEEEDYRTAVYVKGLGPPMEHMKEIARALRCIADELDQDQKMQRIISKVPPDAPQQTFLNVANDFFRDGIITWGRIVALFYFGYKMVCKALDKIPLIRAIINWVINFIVDSVAPWIIERGGWEAIEEYFGTPRNQLILVAGAGIVAAGAVVAYNVWWR